MRCDSLSIASSSMATPLTETVELILTIVPTILSSPKIAKTKTIKPTNILGY